MREKRRWKDLDEGQRRMVVVGAVIQVTLQFLALRDLRHRPAELVRGPKWAWVPATSVNFFGPIAYFVLGRRRTPAGG
ncbi:PLDc N-terminal domain-containing protein [Knoellia sp. p5-6-4]|uniref:PLDc N-terminal domain-containing protein n=1 Tax=unclassified Knoellia TaxID=2618719 RepID=UPI0023DBE0E0|nr:PLDc N-terminal domain-containing protein [Knoellia sp. p5-6-4]MDF2144334.1 PLDc N-terminal domain-containing protein [Knoellia sp. p5-6-4]